MHLNAVKASLLQRKIKVSRAAHKFVAVCRVVPVGLIQRRGAFPVGRIHLAAVFQKMPEPVILASVFVDCLLHTGGQRNLVILLDDLFGTLDNPRENAVTGIGIQVLTVILDVALALNLGIERDDDKATPDAIVGCADAGQMVGVQHKGVAGLEGERVFVLFLRKNVISGAELLDGGIIQTGTFLHLSSNQKTLALDLSHFRLDVSAAADRQGICGDVATVQTQHAGDDIPKGGLTVPTIAVGNDECLDVNLADSSQTANHLHIVDELLIILENLVKAVLPELLALYTGRHRGDFCDEVLWRVFSGTGQPTAQVIGGLWCAKREAICIQISRRDFQHGM